MRWLPLVAGLWLALLTGCAATERANGPATERLPNFVVILVDDLGYADIGPFATDGSAPPTPHLDRMAAEGRRFTDFYVTASVCSASRAGLLTGCYNVRVGILGALGPRADHGLDPDEVTFAEICKQRGYATACYGKWHLGHRSEFLPTRQGFDQYYGLPYSNDMWPLHPEVAHLPESDRARRWPPLPLMDGEQVVNANVTPADQAHLTRDYTERAVQFIAANKARPFCLYLAHSMVHVPLFVSERFRGKSGRGLFGDVVMEVDWSVGQVLAALEAHGLGRDAMVIFTSDNGPWLRYGDPRGIRAPAA